MSHENDIAYHLLFGKSQEDSRKTVADHTKQLAVMKEKRQMEVESWSLCPPPPPAAAAAAAASSSKEEKHDVVVWQKATRAVKHIIPFHIVLSKASELLEQKLVLHQPQVDSQRKNLDRLVAELDRNTQKESLVQTAEEIQVLQEQRKSLLEEKLRAEQMFDEECTLINEINRLQAHFDSISSKPLKLEETLRSGRLKLAMASRFWRQQSKDVISSQVPPEVLQWRVQHKDLYFCFGEEEEESFQLARPPANLVPIEEAEKKGTRLCIDLVEALGQQEICSYFQVSERCAAEYRRLKNEFSFIDDIYVIGKLNEKEIPECFIISERMPRNVYLFDAPALSTRVSKGLYQAYYGRDESQAVRYSPLRRQIEQNFETRDRPFLFVVLKTFQQIGCYGKFLEYLDIGLANQWKAFSSYTGSLSALLELALDKFPLPARPIHGVCGKALFAGNTDKFEVIQAKSAVLKKRRIESIRVHNHKCDWICDEGCINTYTGSPRRHRMTDDELEEIVKERDHKRVKCACRHCRLSSEEHYKFRTKCQHDRCFGNCCKPSSSSSSTSVMSEYGSMRCEDPYIPTSPPYRSPTPDSPDYHPND
jgi:hypothetical protein